MAPDVINLPNYLPPVVDSSVEALSGRANQARGYGRSSILLGMQRSTPRGILRWTSGSAAWGGAPRRDATTRGG